MDLARSIVSVKNANKIPVIAEIKRLIPKLAKEHGLPPDNRAAEHMAYDYYVGGACGISLVTERKHFGGSPERDIPVVLNATPLPLLIKDFILSKADVDYYYRLVKQSGEAYPGRVTLLLHFHMLGEQTEAMLAYVKSRGMSALLETRGTSDLPALGKLKGAVGMIGINNKDIDDLERGDDYIRIIPETVSDFRKTCPKALIISQSAHKTPADVACSVAAGSDGVLVGTAFMLSSNPRRKVYSFVNVSVMAEEEVHK